MTKKLFIKFSMLLFLLALSTNVAWGTNFSGMTDEQAETLGFWARLIAQPATTTTGTGKVFVSEDDHPVTPEDGSYLSVHSADGFSDIYVQTSLVDGDVHFRAYAKANPGSYFTGWSFSDGYTDLGNYENATNFGVQMTPSSTKGHANIREQNLYAAFESIKLVSYAITGSNTTENGTCTQVVTFRAECPGSWALSSTDDHSHFKRPVLVKKEGTNGTWSIDDAAWIGMNEGQNFFASGDNAELKVPVTFTAPDNNPAEYAATLTLETYAGVKMKVYLYARTTGVSGEAIRYNSSKVQQEAGSLATLLSHANANDIIKLNDNYSNPVSINKNITFDLNGFTLSNTLTVSGGNVTIAYSPYGGSANALNVTGGKAILNGGTFGSLTIGASGTVEQNGAVITGAATNNGSLTTTDGKFQGGLTSSKTLIVNGGTFTGATAINVTGGTAQIKKGTITGTTYGVQSAGTTTIEKLAVISGNTMALNRTGGTLTVNNGKFTDPNKLASGDIVFNAAYFQTNSTEASVIRGKQVWRNTAGPEARAGYAFFVGDQEAAQASNVSVCRIGVVSYSSLEDALAYANNNTDKDVIIIMENDYVLPAGYYTLPAKATLIVPMSDDQDVANPIVPRDAGISNPVSFRKLIFADGVNMTVAGTIELTCTQYGSSETMGVPGGNYGHLILKPGSHITISNGGELRAWGFVTGDGTKDGAGNYLSGEIDARRGAKVREMFQMGDWKGGDISFTMAMEMPDPSMPNYRDMTHLFPVYAYFIQNIESPVKYHPGSALVCATSVNVSGSINAYANDIKVVGKYGEDAMFLMDEMADAENTWVRKFYDAKNDKQVYEVNSGAQLGSVVIDLGEVPGILFGAPGSFKLEMDSRKFVLPLTNNFKIHLLSGSMQFTQSTSCLPGMEVEIDKESEISIINQDREGYVEGALYLYDADQWSFQNNQSMGYVGNSGKFGAIVRYSPTWDLGTNGARKKPNVRDISSPAAIGDAILNVHGTFRLGENCAVYTTWSKDMTTLSLDDSESASGGASIVSTNEDAGTFIFDADAPDAFQGLIYDFSDPENPQVVGFHPDVLVNYDHNDYGLGTQYPIQIGTVLGETQRVYGFELCTSAKLKNGDGTFAETQGMTVGTSYCYMNGKWTNMDVAPENGCFMKDNYGTFYAKPSEYVAVAASVVNGKVVGNDDHTFSDKAGTGRLFILMNDCQWWEVEKKDNLYHCIHPNNDTYYYWDDVTNPSRPKWVEKRFTITWKNYDGTEIKSYIDGGDGELQEVEYSVTYGTMAEYLGEIPTRPANIDYTYNFTGWSPALGKVTSDVTYTATYSEQPRKYTIIFLNEGGDEIERHFLTHNEWPVCENLPTQSGFTLQWEPEIAAVTGDATYRATWLENPPTEYQVTFFDYDGETVLQQGNVAVGVKPVAPANPANKPATSEFTYEFDHWSPALEKVSVSSAKSYTAVYREVARTYTVIFQNENGSEIERHEYTWGETPVCSATPTKANTAQYTYSFAWDPQIQTVQGAATYRATFPATTNRYTVTLRCNLPGACTFTGAGTYDYNTSVTIAAIPASGYEFVKWQERAGDANLGSQTITGDLTLTAIVKETAAPVPGDLAVGVNETLTISEPTNYMDVVITSNGTNSGQIVNAENITLYGNADFVLQGSFTTKWYAIAVPWRVDLNDGVFIGSSSTPAVLGKDFEICYYDGSVRAAQGTVDACWIYMRNLSTKKILEPGKAYMFFLRHGSTNKLTFRKKAQEPLLTTGTSVQQYPSSTATDAGWNAIANPSLFYAFINAGANDAQNGLNHGQVYDAVNECYVDFDMSSHKLVVGQPIYVQAPAAKSIVANSSSYVAAPARRANTQVRPTSFEVTLNANGTSFTDKLTIRLNEDKEENNYVIGQDLVKFGVSSKVAQMWVNRYNSKLCVNTVAPEDEATNFPMSIFAPKVGEYTIAIEREAETEDYTLYLTYNGEAIWNLSDGAYTLNLNKGADNNYGLRVSARKAPEITTGFDEAIVDSKDATAAKVLIGNQVFIIRGEKVYGIDGRMVK